MSPREQLRPNEPVILWRLRDQWGVEMKCEMVMTEHGTYHVRVVRGPEQVERTVRGFNDEVAARAESQRMMAELMMEGFTDPGT